MPALDGHAERLDVGEPHRVVRRLEDRLAEVTPDLALVDVEGRGELDVADVVARRAGDASGRE